MSSVCLLKNIHGSKPCNCHLKFTFFCQVVRPIVTELYPGMKKVHIALKIIKMWKDRNTEYNTSVSINQDTKLPEYIQLPQMTAHPPSQQQSLPILRSAYIKSNGECIRPRSPYILWRIFRRQQLCDVTDAEFINIVSMEWDEMNNKEKAVFVKESRLESVLYDNSKLYLEKVKTMSNNQKDVEKIIIENANIYADSESRKQGGAGEC